MRERARFALIGNAVTVQVCCNVDTRNRGVHNSISGCEEVMAWINTMAHIDT